MLTVPSESNPTGGKPAADNTMSRWRSVEVLTAALITLWIAALHVVNLFRAGPFWRDEDGTADFAAMPTIGDIWRNLRYDNFPPLFVSVARVWTLAGLGNDSGYRLLGCLIGLGTLGLLWYCARKLGGRAPLLVLALYGANPLAIRVGDSMRPYGLGIALILLASALIWNFVQNPGRKTLFWATLAATLSVQCLYQNAFFIIAFSCGAWVLTLARREWKTAMQTGIAGLVAASSLLPYWVNIKDSREWFDVSRQEIQFHAIRESLDAALQASGGGMVPVWLALVIAGLSVATYYGAGHRRWNMLYCGAVLVVSVVLYLIFLQVLGLPPHMWYFLILMAPAALMLDAILGGLEMWAVQMGRSILCFILVLACIPACYKGVCVRQSNVDLVAARLKEAAEPGDLILVSPWYLGVSLQHYLDTNLWMTVPPIEEIRIHRYDLLKKAMMSENPIGPLLDKVRTTLSSGHRLWVVGSIRVLPDGHSPPILPPFAGNTAHAEDVYCSNWEFQIADLVKTHAIGGGRVEVPVPEGQAVNPFENIPLRVIHGWRN